MPKYLLFHFSSVQSLHYKDIHSLDLSNIATKINPEHATLYHLEICFIWKDEELISVKEKSVVVLSQKGKSEKIKPSILDDCQCLLVYKAASNMSYETIRKVVPSSVSEVLKMRNTLDHRFKLTDADHKLIGENLHNICRDQSKLKFTDVEILLNNEDFSDNVIHMFLSTFRDDDVGRFTIFSSLEFSRMHKCRVPYRKRKEFWLGYNLTIIPVNIKNDSFRHWVLVIVQKREKIITYIDSLGNYDEGVMRTVHMQLCYESFCLGAVFNCKEWKINIISKCPDFPLQQDCHSCGVYVCMLSECFLLKTFSPKNLSEKHLKMYRMHILKSLTENVLLNDYLRTATWKTTAWVMSNWNI